MAASRTTIDQIIKIMLKYVDRRTAIKMARDLHNHVEGNRAIVEMFSKIAERLYEEER